MCWVDRIEIGRTKLLASNAIQTTRAFPLPQYWDLALRVIQAYNLSRIKPVDVALDLESKRRFSGGSGLQCFLLEIPKAAMSSAIGTHVGTCLLPLLIRLGILERPLTLFALLMVANIYSLGSQWL